MPTIPQNQYTGEPAQINDGVPSPPMIVNNDENGPSLQDNPTEETATPSVPAETESSPKPEDSLKNSENSSKTEENESTNANDGYTEQETKSGGPSDGEKTESYSTLTSENDFFKQENMDGFLCLFGIIVGLVIGAALLRLIQIYLKRISKRIRKVYGVTLQGIGARENQQDSVFLSDPNRYAEQGVLFSVADGMGGLDNGALVSRTAVQVISEKFPYIDRSNPEELLTKLVQAASYSVNALLTPKLGSGGTTLVIGYLDKGKLSFASVGDSQICLVREGILYRLNRQHHYSNELLVACVNGKLSYSDARRIPKQEALTSYLGMGAIKYLDLPENQIPVQKGDRIIIMSDGIYNTLTDQEIAKILRRRITRIPEYLAKKIESKHVKFQDNYSAVILSMH